MTGKSYALAVRAIGLVLCRLFMLLMTRDAVGVYRRSENTPRFTFKAKAHISRLHRV
jgi:hypothetical protein